MVSDEGFIVLPPDRRERRFMLFGASLIVLTFALLTALIWSLFPQGYYQRVAPLDYYPPSPEPYFVAYDDYHLIIVNTGDDLRVFDGHSTRPTCQGGLIYWEAGVDPYPRPTRFSYDADKPEGQRWSPYDPDAPPYFAGRLKDPCHGAVYDLTGANVVGSGPPARGLDAYEYDIRDGDLWVCFACLVPDDPPSDG